MPFENVGQVVCRVYLVGLRLRVELPLARRKQHVAAGLFQALGIGVQGARVAVKVFVRCKLQAVDKNAGHRDVAQRPGLFDERNMAVMQVAHGGHKGRAFEAAEFVAQFGDGVDDVHLVSPGCLL